MAVSTFSAAPSNLTDANFRLWGSQLSAALVAVGMTLVECTGDINWATVSAPSSGTYAGWEVFRFSDALHATHPIFFKLEYGTENYTGVPTLRLTVGRGVDTSSGTLTTPTTVAMPISNGGDNDTTTLFDCFVSGSTGRCNVIMFAGSGTHLCFSIERIKDDSGDPTDDAVNVVVVSNGNMKQQLLPKVGSAFPVATQLLQCDMPSAGTGSWGTNIGFYPIKPNVGYADNPDLGSVLYFTGDLASVGALVTLTLFNVSHTFITAGYGLTTAINGNATAKSIAMRLVMATATVGMRTSILKAATISFTAAPSNISDALFRLWGKALSDALVVVGMIRVECTGDIEWTTVTAPASGNTYPGWEVFRLSDAAHATHPIYFKIEYGGGTYKEAPKVRLTVGRGVNVADGTLTAPTTSTLTIGTSGDHDTTALYDCFISGATGRCNVAMFVGMNAGIAFSIERTKDDNGDPTDAAVNVVTWSQLTTTCVQQQLPKTGDAYPATPQGIQCDLPNTRDGTYGRNVGLFFVRPNLGWADNPDLGAAVYFTDNIVGVGAPIALSVLGTTHTYILSGISANVTINGNNTAYKSIAMRYE